MARRGTAAIRRIAITTCGGDAPGLNAVIRGVVMTALHHNWECVGILNGYDGLLDPRLREAGVTRLTPERVSGITHLGGTILGTTNAGNPFKYPVRTPQGVEERDRSDELMREFKRNGIDALVAIGGDGSLGIAHGLAQKGLRLVGVPKTIDNDLESTVITFGFDSAVSFATECIDRLHTTATSHHRIMVVEVMGRHAGWIALNCGVSANAHAILIPEIPYDIRKVAASLLARERRGSHHSIVVAAEGAIPKGGQASVIEKKIGGHAERLGGIGERVENELAALTRKEIRHVVLGHLLRGGPPTTFDRLLSLRFGGAAVRALVEGQSGVMVALDPPNVRYVPLEKATRRMKSVPPDCDTIRTARDLDISFGD
ncbi:MAG: ATP-dependent 6-phosphofructokinase [Betaproteobacteria bacterium]|nr:ATP-dependent 6-phosphofructokinase [Betaproteobacteria bacterium]